MAYQRRALRLRGYDYAQPGAYFVTICTRKRSCLLGDVADGKMILNDYGRGVEACWTTISNHFPHAQLDAYVVMPNHVHGIITIAKAVGARFPRPRGINEGGETPPLREPTLGKMVAYFKYQSAKRINVLRHTAGEPLWQRNYYEHVIRDEVALNRIRQYIAENPARWPEDAENPVRAGFTHHGLLG